MNSDGFKSRKFLVAAIGSLLVDATATVAWFMDKMTTDQWINLNQWLLPAVLAVFSVANVAEKSLLALPEKKD